MVPYTGKVLTLTYGTPTEAIMQYNLEVILQSEVSTSVYEVSIPLDYDVKIPAFKTRKSESKQVVKKLNNSKGYKARKEFWK
jgi:hypothetical protein